MASSAEYPRLVIIKCCKPGLYSLHATFLLLGLIVSASQYSNLYKQLQANNSMIVISISHFSFSKWTKYICSGTSWSCPSPTLTPPFPLPPTEGEDPDPVEALLQLAANGRQCSLSTTNVTGTEQESDEGIVSDQSNEFEENKKVSFIKFYQSVIPLLANIVRWAPPATTSHHRLAGVLTFSWVSAWHSPGPSRHSPGWLGPHYGAAEYFAHSATTVSHYCEPLLWATQPPIKKT